MFEKSTFPLTAAPCSYEGSHACGQSGRKSKNLVTQTEGCPCIHVYLAQNNDSSTRTVIILYKYIGARKKFDVHNNDSSAEPTPPIAQSVSIPLSRRSCRAKNAHSEQTKDTSAVSTSGIITNNDPHTVRLSLTVVILSLCS